jgi:hypothetical protein
MLGFGFMVLDALAGREQEVDRALEATQAKKVTPRHGTVLAFSLFAAQGPMAGGTNERKSEHRPLYSAA